MALVRIRRTSRQPYAACIALSSTQGSQYAPLWTRGLASSVQERWYPQNGTFVMDCGANGIPRHPSIEPTTGWFAHGMLSWLTGMIPGEHHY
jgi:hypothetical protein